MTQYSGKVIRKTPVTPTQTSASGVWKLNEQAAAIRNNTWPVPGVPNPISRSVRFRSSASAYLNRTYGTPTSTTTWTYSYWVKRGALSSYQTMISGTGGGGSGFLFNTDNTIGFYSYSGGYQWNLVTTQVFRDPSAWYHIIVAYDSTQATSSNRVKIYVNGSQVTSFSTATYPSLNTAGYVGGAAGVHRIGLRDDNFYYLDGYLTEINFIDGQALTPSSFGTTDTATGAWIPMPYTGTYGANGFYLNFKDNTSTTTIGYDYSGNSNNWTANNISLTAGSTYDSMLDVPTQWVGYSTGDTTAVTRGNYPTLDPNNPTYTDGSGQYLSAGNLIYTPSGDYSIAKATMAFPKSGKFYVEATIGATGTPGSGMDLGILRLPGSSTSTNSYVTYQSTYGYAYDRAGYIYKGTGATTVTSGLTTSSNNDVIAMAVDVDNQTVTWYRNNVSLYTLNLSTAPDGYYLNDGEWIYAVSAYGGAASWNVNFGQRPFTYTPPTGYKTLCTTNLPTPTITNGANYMAASTYTGNGSTQSIVNSGNNTAALTFQPDFVWLKNRSGVENHQAFDSVRGANNSLYPNLTNAAGTDPGVTAFNSNGFSLGGTSNNNAATYIAWQWQAGAGTTSSNTSGSITSTVSVNQTAGFSVVTYTGTGGSGTTTVGHGLSVAPSMVVIKNRSSATDWAVYHTSLTSTSYYVLLDSTAAQASYGSTFISPGSTTLTIAAGSSLLNTSTNNYVAYCWAAVAGYSAFGSYTGNGSADGPFVYCGHRSRFVLIKRTDTGGYDWVIYDTSRNTYNAVTLNLDPNSSAAETNTGSNGMDINSNGFKIRDTSAFWNASGGTYIYAAFAENPFKYSNAR